MLSIYYRPININSISKPCTQGLIHNYVSAERCPRSRCLIFSLPMKELTFYSDPERSASVLLGIRQDICIKLLPDPYRLKIRGPGSQILLDPAYFNHCPN